MLKKIITVLFAFVLLIPTTVYADTYPKEDLNWTVTFNGSELTTNRSEAEVAGALAGMEPGDDAVLQMEVRNDSKEKTTWYLSNEVVQSFEESSSGSGGAYTYTLTYTGPDGTSTVLYSSAKVGGTKPSDAGADYEEGLYQATDALGELFRLGDLTAGQSGRITVQIGLNGETQQSNYQGAMANLKFDLSVEFTPQGEKKQEIRHLIPGTGINGFTGAKLVNIYSVTSLILLVILAVTGTYLYRRRKGDAR